jgi:ankyrin repeat protein
MLLDRGANPSPSGDLTPLMTASSGGHLEVVRLLLGHTTGKTTINHRGREGKTALYLACFNGRGAVARALLESGADPTIALNNGFTPMAVAKRDPGQYASAEGRRECVAALEVRPCLLLLTFSQHLLF